MTKLLVLSAGVAVVALCWLFFARPIGESAMPAETQADGLERASELTASNLSLDSHSSPSPEVAEHPSSSRIASTVATAPSAHALRILGRVVDKETGAPVVCRVEFVQRDVSSTPLLTDAAGRFETAAMFTAGSVEVRTTHFWSDVAQGVPWTVEQTELWLTDADTEVELLATHGVRIDVEVRNSDSTPAPHPSLRATLHPQLEFVDHRRAANRGVSIDATGDGSGRTVLWVSQTCVKTGRLFLRAESDGGTANEMIEPPLSVSPIVLVLKREAIVHVRVVDMHRAPVRDATVRLTELHNGIDRAEWFEDTGEHGEASFAEIPQVRCRLSVEHRSTRRATETIVDVGALTNAEVEVVLPDSPLKRAVLGFVISEIERPMLGVSVRVTIAGKPQTVVTDVNGSFEVWAQPSDDVTVEVGVNALDDEYEPSSASVEFGTKPFFARRVRKFEQWICDVRVVDRRTGELIPAARISTAGSPDGAFNEWLMHGGVLRRFPMTDRADAYAFVSAYGYRPVLRPCRELHPSTQPCGTITIELDRGFEQSLSFIDSETAEPLSDVKLTQPSGAVARADAQGNVLLSASEWPLPYFVEREGYRSVHWDPRDWPAWKKVVALDKMSR